MRRSPFPHFFIVRVGLRLVTTWEFVLTLLLFCPLNRAQADQPAELRVCFLEDNLPYSSRQQNSGLDVDTAKAVADALGQPLTAIWVKNATRIDEIEESDLPLRRLSRNECDVLFSVPGEDAIKDSPKVTIGVPYYGAAFELIGRDGNVPASLDTLGQALVAVQAQTVANFVLAARKAKMQTFFSVEAALTGLAKGEATAALVWGPSAGWYVRNHPELNLVFASNYVPPAVVCWNEHAATRKSDTALRQRIDTALAQLGESGALPTLLARYGIPFHKPFAVTYSLAEMQKLR